MKTLPNKKLSAERDSSNIWPLDGDKTPQTASGSFILFF